MTDITPEMARPAAEWSDPGTTSPETPVGTPGADSTTAGRIVVDEGGQATAEYALVIVAAAAIALALIIWATSTGTLSSLFDAVLAKVTSYV